MHKAINFNTVCKNKSMETAQMFFSTLNQGIHTLELCATVKKKWEL